MGLDQGQEIVRALGRRLDSWTNSEAILGYKARRTCCERESKDDGKYLSNARTQSAPHAARIRDQTPSTLLQTLHPILKVLVKNHIILSIMLVQRRRHLLNNPHQRSEIHFLVHQQCLAWILLTWQEFE